MTRSDNNPNWTYDASYMQASLTRYEHLAINNCNTPVHSRAGAATWNGVNNDVWKLARRNQTWLQLSRKPSFLSLQMYFNTMYVYICSLFLQVFTKKKQCWYEAKHAFGSSVAWHSCMGPCKHWRRMCIPTDTVIFMTIFVFNWQHCMSVTSCTVEALSHAAF